MDNALTTTVYLVRHAEVHNPEGIIYGRLPRFKLSARGREQAARSARLLAREPLAAIYTSPQLRARQTAAAIAAHHPGAPVRVSRLLAEVKTSWQGSSGAALGKLFNFYEPLPDPADESIADIFRRMERAVRLALGRHPGQKVALVSHGDPIVIARTGYAGLPLAFPSLRGPHYPSLGSLTILTFDGEAALPHIAYVDPSPNGTL